MGVVLVDGADVFVLLVDVVADAFGGFGQGVFVDGLEAVVLVVCFFVGGDAVVSCVEGALEGRYGGCGGVGGSCEGWLSLRCFLLCFTRGKVVLLELKQPSTRDEVNVRCPELSPLIAGNECMPAGYLAYTKCHYPALVLLLAVQAKYSILQARDLRCVVPLAPNRPAR